MQKKQRTDDQATQSTQIPRVNPNDTTKVQKGQSSITTVREAVGFADIPPAAHELAAILQFGTSYELVEWLARRLQEVSERMAQEQKDQIMIQKSLSGAVEPREQHELDQIGQHCSARNKGEAIQMPPLHEALVEVHREYEKASRAAKDMADLYKKSSVVSEVLNAQCTNMKAENQQLTEQLLQVEEQLQKTRDELLQKESSRPLEADQELQQKLQQVEAAFKAAEARAEKAEIRSKKLEDRIQLAKTEIGKWLDAKDELIQQLRRKLAQQQEAMCQNVEQVEELEEYVNVQIEYFAEEMVGKDTLLNEINEKYNKQ